MTADATGSPHGIGVLQAQTSQRSAAPGSAQRLAWQREMERAQGENWFKKPLPEQSHQSRPNAAPNQRRQPSERESNGAPAFPTTIVAPERFRALTQLVSTITSGSTDLTVRAAVATTSTERSSRTPHASISRHDVVADLQPETRLALSDARAQTGRAANLTGVTSRALAEPPTSGHFASIRWHVQWDGDQARVWFGLDAEHAKHVEQLASQVQRWLESQGVRVLSLVCNGKPVLDLPRPGSGESLAHSAPSFMLTPSGQSPERFDSFFDLITIKET